MVKPDGSAGCTPGEWITDPDTSRAHVCAAGYNPRPPESVTRRFKDGGLRLYGLPVSAARTMESDHRFPVWLGGATTRRNLWPEPNYPAARQTAFVHNPKDELEFRIYSLTCRARTMTVARARRIFEAADWRREYRRYATG